MTDKTIGQIWYTWSSIGLDNIRAGYRVRAASPHLVDVDRQDRRYASFMPYLQYELPLGMNPNAVAPAQAPINLTFAETPYGNILVSKVYIGPDGVGRPGNYFAHLLAYMPEGFSAREAIELWKSPLWQKQDEPLEKCSTQLDKLSISDLAQIVPQKFHFTDIQQQLGELIQAFLSPTKLQPRVRITGSCQNIIMLIWGLTHSLPKTLLPGLTFTTYEHDPDKSTETIVGTVTARELTDAHFTKTIVTINHLLREDDNTAVGEYVAYALKCLDESEDGQSENLQTIIRQAEKSNITTIKEFLELSQKFITSQKLTQLVHDFRIALEQEDWSKVAGLCYTFNTLYPPVNNQKAWVALFHSLSQNPWCRLIRQHRPTHQWLFDGLQDAWPEAVNHLDQWLSCSSNDLETFLSLKLPARWHEQAIVVILLSPHWQQTNLAQLAIKYQLLFSAALQHLATIPEEDCMEALLDFFLHWEPDDALKEHFYTLLLDTPDIARETRQRLLALAQPDSVSPSPILSHSIEQATSASQPTEEIRVQSPTTNIRTPIADLFVNVFHLGMHIATKPLNRRNSLLVLTIVFLLCTNALTYWATTLNASTSEAAIRATAFAQGRSTLLDQQAQTATAVARGEDGKDDSKLIAYYPQNIKVNVGKSFTIYVITKNTGTSSWSDSRGYTLGCIPPPSSQSDPDCQNAKVSRFFDGTVPSGEIYVLSITLLATKPESHSITLSLIHHGQFFGSQLQVPFVVQSPQT